jgi:predicted ATPase
MIKSLKIEHFRNLKQVEINDLGRINILLGKNNSGKTVIQEALFLLAPTADPLAALRNLNLQRGYDIDADSPDFWNSFFYNWDITRDIFLEITVEGDLPFTKELKIEAIQKQTDSAIGEISELNRQTVGLHLILVEKESGREVKFELPLSYEKGIVVCWSEDPSKHVFPISFLVVKVANLTNQEAQRFSRLDIGGRYDEILTAMQIIEPRLKRLTVAATQRGSVIYGDLGTEHLIPISLMGEGTTRILSIVLAILNSKGGIVMIDEAESGLHYSVLVALWKMIAETARRLDVQVFAATHSYECIQAIHEAIEDLGYIDDLKAYRFDRIGETTRVVDYTAEMLATGFEMGLEMR